MEMAWQLADNQLIHTRIVKASIAQLVEQLTCNQ